MACSFRDVPVIFPKDSSMGKTAGIKQREGKVSGKSLSLPVNVLRSANN